MQQLFCLYCFPIMDRSVTCIVLIVVAVKFVTSSYYLNYTGDSAARQLWDFARDHPVPIGVQTTSSGEPVEVRHGVTINSDTFANQYHIDLGTHFDAERTPERFVHAKGNSAFGYFEVTNDVSKYTSAEVFNGIGKKTRVAVRFSRAIPSLGGSEVGHDNRGLAVKFYTKEGNLDLLSLNVPVYLYRDPLDFVSVANALKRNPRTSLSDASAIWDFVTLRPAMFNAFLWILSDYGSPDGYRKMDAFAIHTFEINNKNSEKFYVKFNFRTEQGLANLTAAQIMAIGPNDPDYYTRDLHNAITDKNYPTWRLELDVMTEEDVKKIDYNPFDVTVLWKKGTYHTVPVGRLVLDQVVNNHFADSEQAAYSPGNLVPGIPGPVDFMFKCRRFTYKDAVNYRLGVNHNKIEVNLPIYANTYNRDGNPPLRENMNGVPNYYPNSYNGPVPYVDERRPERSLVVIESNAVDFNEPAYFYNHIIKDDAHRQRLADNSASFLQSASPNIAKRVLKMYSWIDKDLRNRTAHSLRQLKSIAMAVSNEKRWEQNAQCYVRLPPKSPRKY